MPKTTPDAKRQVLPKKPPTAERLFVSLCAQVGGGHYANALKTCDKILRLDPNDEDTLQTKLFLLLQTDQYDGALSLIESAPEEGRDRRVFERAYSLYRLHREGEVRQILEARRSDKNGGIEDRGTLHLEAQLNYRSGAYDAAFDLYQQLLNTAEPRSEEYSDILTNLQASQTHLDFVTVNFLQVIGNLPSSISTNLETNPPPVPPSHVSAS